MELNARHVCVATGSRPHTPDTFRSSPGAARVPLNFTATSRIVTSTEMGNMLDMPKAVAIIGGGIIAVEYATVLSKLGVGVSLLCKENEFLPFLEEELRETLRRRMRRSHVLFVTEDVKDIEVDPAFVKISLQTPTPSTGEPVSSSATAAAVVGRNKTPVERKLKVDLLLYSSGRDANSEGLGLDAVGVTLGSYGRIAVDSRTYRTSSPCAIYAVGDVIGPPGLASAAQHQARSLVDHLFGKKSAFAKRQRASFGNKDAVTQVTQSSHNDDDDNNYDDDLDVERDNYFASPAVSGSEGDHPATLFGDEFTSTNVPLTLWTMPEIASVGLTLKQAMAREASRRQQSGRTRVFLEGKACFKETARGRLTGDTDGFLKVV